jgi:hypothetical protein
MTEAKEEIVATSLRHIDEAIRVCHEMRSLEQEHPHFKPLIDDALAYLMSARKKLLPI